jgi:hypothetical protein
MQVKLTDALFTFLCDIENIYYPLYSEKHDNYHVLHLLRVLKIIVFSSQSVFMYSTYGIWVILFYEDTDRIIALYTRVALGE